MNSKPSSDEAHRRRVIHQMVSELASIKPSSKGYQRKLAVLADYIAFRQPAKKRLQKSRTHRPGAIVG